MQRAFWKHEIPREQRDFLCLFPLLLLLIFCNVHWSKQRRTTIICKLFYKFLWKVFFFNFFYKISKFEFKSCGKKFFLENFEKILWLNFFLYLRFLKIFEAFKKNLRILKNFKSFFNHKYFFWKRIDIFLQLAFLFNKYILENSLQLIFFLTI